MRFPSTTRPEKYYLRKTVKYEGLNNAIYIAETAKKNGIIPGILMAKPGIFWNPEMDKVREQLVAFLKKKKLPDLAVLLTQYGKEKNNGPLIIDDPAVQKFLGGIKQELKNKSFAFKLAKLLKKIY
jgi:hypothetical protein